MNWKWIDSSSAAESKEASNVIGLFKDDLTSGTVSFTHIKSTNDTYTYEIQAHAIFCSYDSL